MKTTFFLLFSVSLWTVSDGLAGENSHIQFSFGTNKPASGFTVVQVTNLFHHGAAFGFAPGASVREQGDCVTSDRPFLFSVKLTEGNYAVSLTLGDVAGESSTTVKAEARRLMLENVHTAKGEIVTREFTVNIRTPRIGDNGTVRLKQRENDSEMVTWDEGLSLEFNGSRPCLRTLEITPAPDVPTVFLAGDSTVCDQPLEPWNSWGQMLPRFFKPGVAVANYAQSGESIKSSLSARRFEKIFSLMKPSDWLLVQFGHNDMKDKAPDALITYRRNLKSIVTQTRAKGGTPVLISSMERKAGMNAPTLAGYPDAVRGVATEDNVALVDLNAMSVQLYRALGANLGQAFQDGTHHNNYGSYELAKCVAAGIAHAKLDLARFLLEEVKTFDPAHPDPVGTFAVPPSPSRSTAKPDGN
jgi:lysophospholipase L1-like esterase